MEPKLTREQVLDIVLSAIDDLDYGWIACEEICELVDLKIDRLVHEGKVN